MDINLTIGNRTYSYGSEEAYAFDMGERETRMKRLAVNAMNESDGDRKDELYAMLAAQKELAGELHKAYMAALREYYKSLAQG